MCKAIIRCILRTLLVLPLLCSAQQRFRPTVADPLLEPWRWREVNELNELGVLCMAQAPGGVYWFGGIDCVASYDGMDVERIPFDDELLSMISRDLPKPRARAILMLDDDRLLAVVGRSLVLRQGEVWNLVIPNTGYAHFESRMEQSNDGSIWLLTRTKLWHISKDLSEFSEIATASGNAFFSAFCIDSSGSIWLAQRTSHQRADLIHIPVRAGRPYAAPLWILHRIPIERPGNEVGLSIDSDGLVWYADNGAENGFCSFNPRDNLWDTTLGNNLSRNFFSLTRARDGTIWAGGNGCLYAIRGEGSGFYSREQLGLPSVPSNLFETRDERLWIIGRIGHVYYLDRGFRHWKTYQGLHFECETDKGVQWFIAENGTAVSHDQASDTWLQHGEKDGMVERALSITHSIHGLIWVAGRYRGRAAISVFDGVKWTRLLHLEFAENMGRDGVWKAADSTLWFSAGGQILSGEKGTGGMLQFGVNDSGEPYLMKHHSPPVVPYHVGKVAQSRDGTMWIGSSTVHRWKPGAGRAEPILDIPLTTTHDLIIDDNDGVWVAKLGSGIYFQRERGGDWVVNNDGLASQQVCDLLLLKDGTVLAASDKGISRFDGTSWAGHVFSQDFAMASRGGIMRQSPDGSLWMNFTQADPRSPRVLMNEERRFSTVRYTADHEAPETEIVQHSDRVSPPGNVYISWSGRDRFARTQTDDLQYSWRFNGGAWSPFSDEYGRTFLNLSDGRYDFEVRARDDDFNIDQTPARILFTVLPPVWKQAWFIFLMIVLWVLVSLLVWMFIRYREHRLREQKNRMEEQARHLEEMDQLKSGFFTNISHELNTPLTLVLGPLERILKREHDESKRKLLNQAMRNVERVSTLAGQLMDFRRLEKGKLSVDLAEGDAALSVRETVELMMPMADAKNVRCVVGGLDVLPGRIDRDKLHKIVQNLLGNAIKYTPAGGEVSVSVIERQDGMRREMILSVEDSGPGIEKEHLDRIFERFYRIPEKRIVDGSGIGLNLTKELVELWGGTITAESPVFDNKDRPGSRFRVSLPLDAGRDEHEGKQDG